MEIKKLPNGFEYIEVINDVASAKIALQGAHIFEYKVKGKEDLLWLSTESDFEYGKAIRGGIPICWPSFGMNNPELPQHGFARVALFSFVSLLQIDSKTSELILTLEDDEATHRLWNYKFKLEVLIRISDTLEIELKTTNKDKKSFVLTQALHTYFSVSSIEDVKIFGLEDKPYYNALLDIQERQNSTIEISEEFDNVYQEVDKPLLLQDKRKKITIKSEACSSVVVWNPWIEKCKRMSAMKEDAYKEFVCIESANALDDFKILQSGESCGLKATLNLEKE
jgi:glucose-6-phosphate 1-epimerase